MKSEYYRRSAERRDKNNVSPRFIVFVDHRNQDTNTGIEYKRHRKKLHNTGFEYDVQTFTHIQMHTIRFTHCENPSRESESNYFPILFSNAGN